MLITGSKNRRRIESLYAQAIGDEALQSRFDIAIATVNSAEEVFALRLINKMSRVHFLAMEESQLLSLAADTRGGA